MKNMCPSCDKKDNCVELCKEAEKYANQDFVQQPPHVVNVENMEVLEDDSVWSYSKSEYTRDEIKRLIIQLHKDGKMYREIAYYLPCSFQYAHKVIKRYKSEKIDKYGKEK